MRNTNIDFIVKYRDLIFQTHKEVMKNINIDKKSIDNINAIVGNCLLAMNYDNKEWTQTEIITYLTQKILFEHPFLDGNKRTAFSLLLNELKVDKNKIKEICDFLWNK